MKGESSAEQSLVSAAASVALGSFWAFAAVGLSLRSESEAGIRSLSCDTLGTQERCFFESLGSGRLLVRPLNTRSIHAASVSRSSISSMPGDMSV